MDFRSLFGTQIVVLFVYLFGTLKEYQRATNVRGEYVAGCSKSCDVFNDTFSIPLLCPDEV